MSTFETIYSWFCLVFFLFASGFISYQLWWLVLDRNFRKLSDKLVTTYCTIFGILWPIGLPLILIMTIIIYTFFNKE